MLVAYKAKRTSLRALSASAQLVQQTVKYWMADPAATTTSGATTTTTTAATGSSASGLGLDPAILEALRAAVQAEVRAALPLAPPGSEPGPSIAATGTPLLPTASSAPSGELMPRDGLCRAQARAGFARTRQAAGARAAGQTGPPCPARGRCTAADTRRNPVQSGARLGRAGLQIRRSTMPS